MSLDELSLGRQSSIGSLSLSLPPAVPKTAPFGLVTTNGTMGNNPDYINTNMEDHSWFVGEMDREAANARLSSFPASTFLVRCRVQNGQKLGYALSLKTTDDVKHMKIAAEANNGLFFLSDTRKFRSVVELISWFSRNSLKESFSGLVSGFY